MNDINMFDEINWKEKYEKEHRLRQEAEGEAAMIKATTVYNSPEMREMKTKLSETEIVLKGTKQIVNDMHKENRDIFERLAETLEIDERHREMNGKLQTRLTELEQENIELYADNKKLAKQVDDSVDRMRKAGLL
jgi:2,4-dienoyl-CoA reductase-like NADH-dependent reductase (Old Yellow Enzyme family)